MSSHQPRYGYGAPAPGRRGPNKVLLVVLVAVIVLLLVGCAAMAVVLVAADGEGSASATSERVAVAPAHTVTGTRGLNPCDLVTHRDATRLGLGKGGKDSLVPRTCTWDLAKPGDTVRVWMQDSIGLAVLPAGGHALHLGSHDAIRSLEPTVGPLHSCQVAIGVTGNSRVDVVANASASTSLACSVAMRTARVVEPNLP
ncbi:MAG TPA: DUF3558 family protein [Nocardioidaceae bacterium]|nr:DUF3558 family protein [Nocardioidaceae bacterium]